LPLWTVGLGGSDHEFSCALMCDGDIRVAIEDERLTRRKHGYALWYENPIHHSLAYCLDAERVSHSDIAGVVSSDIIPFRVRHELRAFEMRLYGHHLCHAASAYLLVPSGKRAGIVVCDGYGSRVDHPAEPQYRCHRETFSFFVFGPAGYECLGVTAGLAFADDESSTSVTNSLGMLYEFVTGLLGNQPMDCGKTMGLSAYGEPRYLDAFERFISYGAEPSACFTCAIDDPAFATMINGILDSRRGSFAVKADLAATVQAITNATFLRCAHYFRSQRLDVLCIVGGCGLNTVANAHVVEHCGLDVPVSIPPHCSDAGTGLGALWLDRFHATNALPNLTFRGGSLNPGLCRPGRIYSMQESRAAVQEFYPRLSWDPGVVGLHDVAKRLAKGDVIGFFAGGSEIGPRALGGRSILANPASAAVRERINRVLKHREPYRPLAPVVLRSRFEDYFVDLRQADEFMLKVAHVTDKCRRDAPAVVHVDGTARVQVLNDGDGGELVELLRMFGELSGLGVLVNTSFNRRGEPLVETPADAIDAFLGMRLDGLYLNGDYYLASEKRPSS
jgi:carbamoyltransferase